MKQFLKAGLISFALIAADPARAVEETWVFAVQLTVTVQAAPARIELNWVTDSHPVSGYTVYRKSPGASEWGAGIELPASATRYIDDSVELGTVYEYQVVKQANYPHNGPAYRGYGYIAAAINASLVDQRGKVILVVDQSVAGELSGELERLQRDLAGDGWTVVRKDVPRDAPPGDVRNLIRAEYEADRERTKAVFLLGRVPIVRSGNLNVDGHETRPMPADVYYGEMNGEWTDRDGNGVLDQSLLPSDVELQVGRVDFAGLTGESVNYKFPSEIELLKRYLDKNHAYRHASVRPAARALVANPMGDANGQAYAASAYRNFSVLVGPDNVRTVEAQTGTPVEERFAAQLAKADYLWAYGCGSGGDFAVNGLGANGEFNGLWSPDFIEQKARATFYQFFGSWFADWSKTDNLMRSALTAPGFGLAASWSGRPHHFFHAMGIGETIGYGIRVSQNNDGTLYQNQVQRQLRGIHIALMGDPTLRLNPVAPPREFAALEAENRVLLSWKPSADPILGYHVYRSIGGGPFARLTNEWIQDTAFVDDRSAERATYMVRAITLQLGPSGSYYNASQGVFASVGGTGVIAAHANPSRLDATKDTDIVWFDDELPPGAIAYASENDGWSWVTSGPAPFSGTAAHQSSMAAGLHQHFFAFAESPLAISSGDTLVVFVFLDPASPPRQIMVTWLAGDWEHRAYWGENLIEEGTDGTAARKFMGALPPAGRWVRLEVPAGAVAMENRTATGMGFAAFDGRVTWDRAGKSRP